MLATLRKRIDREDEGFTLIELMVVVLIIAILLAIAIPTFLGAQDRARDRGAQSNLRNSLTAAKTISTDTEGIFTSVDASSLNTAEPSLIHVDTALTAASVPKNVRVQTSPGLVPPNAPADATVKGVLYLTVRSASGKYYGICADYKGNVQYAPGATSEPLLGACTAAKF